MTVEVCPDCDIADCSHIQARRKQPAPDEVTRVGVAIGGTLLTKNGIIITNCEEIARAAIAAMREGK